MLDAKVTSKGQITIPKAVRDSLGIRPGDEVEFVIEADGACSLRKRERDAPFDKWRGTWQGFEGWTTDEIMKELRGYDAEDERILAKLAAEAEEQRGKQRADLDAEAPSQRPG